MPKEQVRILFEDLTPETREIVKEIKKIRRIRGGTEIIGALVSLFYRPDGIVFFFIGRKKATKEIKIIHKELAEKIKEKGFLKSGKHKGKYPREWIFNQEAVIKKLPVMLVTRKGDLVFRKPTKTELFKIKMHIGRHRKLFQKRKFLEEKFMEKIKRKPTKEEKAFEKIAKRLKRITRK